MIHQQHTCTYTSCLHYHKSNQLALHATVIDQDAPVLIAAEFAESSF